MKRFEEIGMKENWIYEVIISTLYDSDPHAAPMGIWSEDLDTLNMLIYNNSTTLKNIMKEEEFAANLVDDITIFYGSLFNKSKITYMQSKQITAPVIKGSSASIECKVKHIARKENRFHVKAKIVDIRVWDEIKLINRAESLVLESLIMATRLPLFPGRRIEEILKENFRVIAKVAPGSTYEHIMEKVMIFLKL